MRQRLDFGRGGLQFDIPDGVRAEVVESPRATPLADPVAAVERALADPVESAPLAVAARGRRDAVIVISDKTRPVPNGVVLPPILQALDGAGIDRQRIEILVGTGLHRPNTPQELAEMTSPQIVARYRIRNHVARDAASHRSLGRTRRGTEIWLDAGYLDADLKIVTGLIEPHLMAGFSGGRKGVAPGLAGVEMMRHLHGPAMLEDHIGPGILDGNPFHEELVEIARRAGVDFLVNVAIDRGRRLTGVFAGDLEAAHRAGVRAVEQHVRVDVEAPADVVVTSAGGYPLDATFYQAIKGLIGALNVVKRGGTIILAAEISEGIGSAEFRRLLADIAAHDEFLARLAAPGFFVIDQWMAQHLCQVLRKAEVAVVSPGLYLGEFPRLPIGRAPSVEEALRRALARHGRGARVLVVPEGPYVLGTVRGRKLPIGRAWLDDAA
ncbi:MAG: nickel-dependent lactate racemase [Deltaproteobacteria bacterium]|nr:nickel-dependent lactate racemase [Deltaproteobacteria bacterium]